MVASVQEDRPVAVIGAGSIGVAWALVFALAGMRVRLQDPDPARRLAAPGELADKVRALAGAGLFDGSAPAVNDRVAIVESLGEAVADACHVQENAPEQLALKRELFTEIARLAPADATLASSSSAIVASAFAPESVQDRCLVVHPGNPPFLLRVVEVVPSPATSVAATDSVMGLMHLAGMRPVLVRKEIEGFVFNRLQGAVLREAYCLVRDGVIDVADLDTVMTEGLGLRWSVIGPFETADLNTRGGIASHALKMGPAYARMGMERGQNDPWSPDLVSRVDSQCRAAIPLADWEARVAWRDSALMKIALTKRGLPPFKPEKS
jgi:L-gulonate 3-dehydrogenase